VTHGNRQNETDRETALDLIGGTSWSLISAIRSILKAVASPIEKILFRRAYEISTLVKCRRQILGRFSHSLTADLEYDIHWGKYYLRDEIFCPLFWIKSRSGKYYSKIVLVVNALSTQHNFQCAFTLYDFGPHPIRTTLPSIPLRVLQKNVLVKNGRIHSPYLEVQIKVVELWDESGNEVSTKSLSLPPRLSPLDRLEVAMGQEKGDVEKWGQVYNFEFLESEIKEEQIRLRSRYYIATRIRDKLKGQVLGWTWIVQISFWRKNLIWATHLSKEYAEFLKQQQEVDEFRKKQGDQ
jgi:hypothetical protein